jgi:hypothetical protein
MVTGKASSQPIVQDILSRTCPLGSLDVAIVTSAPIFTIQETNWLSRRLRPESSRDRVLVASDFRELRDVLESAVTKSPLPEVPIQ